MKNTLSGLRRYLYEYEFHQLIEDVSKRSGAVITVSSARALRSKVEESLVKRGLSMNDAKLPLDEAQRAFHEVFETVPGYDNRYADPTERGATNPGYLRARNGFFAIAGFGPAGSTGKNGPLLPISPYDPRWAVRSTMKHAGASLLYITDHDVELRADGTSVNGLTDPDQELQLNRLTEDGRLYAAGPAYSRDDQSGMTELMGYMSRSDYRSVRNWVIDQDSKKYMSEAGIARAKAILEELQEQGVDFRITRDRNPGQLAVHVKGTKIAVRLTDTRDKEGFVGRVYDDGIATYFSTNYRNQNSYALYEPTPSETVALLRAAQGLPVQRADGKGLVGIKQHDGDAYFGDDNGQRTVRFAFGDYLVDGKPQLLADGTSAQVFVHRKSDRSETSTWFGTGEAGVEAGTKFLELAVTSARQRVEAELGVDALLEQFAEHEEEAVAGEWYPQFSGDEQIAPIQRGYWDVLRGAQHTLLRPGFSKEDFDDRTAVLSEIEVSGETYESALDMLVGVVAYTGTREARVRAHARDVVDGIVGTYEPRDAFVLENEEPSTEPSTFDPAAVAKYMASPYGVWRNGADLIAAMRAAGYGYEELNLLQGENSVVRRVRDDLIAFDPSTAADVAGLKGGSFAKKMVEVAQDALERNGVTVLSMQLDANGILDWRGIRHDRLGRQLTGFYKTPEELHGQIGQIFEPGEHGEIVTQFGSRENYMFVPGYEARIVAQKPGEDLSMEERTRLRGYEQIMTEQIRYQIAGDALTKRTEVGGPTALNNVYRRLYDERHEVDFLDRAEERGLDRGWAESILETERRRVRYANELSDTFYESWAAEQGVQAFDPANDSFGSVLVQTGGRNVAIMDERSDGYFDPDLTNAARPGVARFLVESASVDVDGRIIPGEKDDRAPIMKHPETWAMRFDPYDRRQMTGMNLLHASGVTRPRGTALMTFGGWGADDGVVVSKEFAEEHKILGKDGNMRNLVVGDKISDLHGNKGVISLVIDRDTDYDLALQNRDQSMMYATNIFKMNPELDVVMSPFSAVGRFNGGTARELMESPSDLTLPWKGMQPDLMGQMRFIVTHKDVKAGTRVYDEQALAQGRGRKASAQLAWALDSQNATEVLREFYGPNGNAVANFREMLVSVGLDMLPDGTLVEGSAENESERGLLAMPELILKGRNQLDKAAMLTEFANQINSRGGDLELPFQLRFPSQGADLPGRLLPQTESGTWRMPILSSQLRTGQMLDDGTNAAHEFTTQYLKVFEAACDYRFCQARLDGQFGEVHSERAEELRRRMAQDVRMAQSAFSTVNSTLKETQFTGHSNIFKEGLMSSRVPNSATAVWSADPRLDIDQIAMNSTMASGLGVNDGDYVLVWRDPVLRDAGVRYLRVAIDERLTGVAINPVMDKGFDGDFDGDSVAVVKLHGERARAEAMQKLSVEANLLDLGAVESIKMGGDREEQIYPLMMQDSLDVKVTQSVQPQFVEQFGKLTMRANEVQSDFEAGEISAAERLRQNRELLTELSSYYKEVLEGQYGDAALSFENSVAHLASVKAACIDTGAKGSPAKLAAYAKHLGVDDHGVDTGRPLHTREEDQGVMVATAVKTAVGIAGAFSQRGVRALRNSTQKSVLELTYPVTQSLLQSKHDPHEALQKYTLLLSSVRDLWKGNLMQRVAGKDGSGASWEPVTDSKSKAVIQATPEQWQEQFLDMYRSKDGLNIPTVNPEHVAIVAKALTGPDGLMRDIEAIGSGADREEGLANGSTMDRLAYGGTFEELYAAATRKENIFDGAQNGHFAPFEVQRNQRELEQYERRIERAADDTRSVPGPELVSVGARDVLTSENERFRERGTSRRSPLATTVRAPQRVVETPAEPEESDGFEYGL
ncbi:MAG TPA: hypothetical protein VFU07_05285 [Candidatus Lumbricidophila sp.]|nr:hypothetical protein [Candidatus Lumbricidophila sp.]